VGSVHTVVDDPGDGNLRRRPPLGMGDGHDRHPVGVDPVEIAELLVERAVDGRSHGQAWVVLGVEGTHDRVVVDHVAVPNGLVGVDDVADLGDHHTYPGPFGLGEDPLTGNRASRVTGGKK
jgi:hypothetical protein